MTTKPTILDTAYQVIGVRDDGSRVQLSMYAMSVLGSDDVAMARATAECDRIASLPQYRAAHVLAWELVPRSDGLDHWQIPGTPQRRMTY